MDHQQPGAGRRIRVGHGGVGLTRQNIAVFGLPIDILDVDYSQG